MAPEPKISEAWLARSRVAPLVANCHRQIAVSRGEPPGVQPTLGQDEALFQLALAVRKQVLEELELARGGSGVIPSTRDPFDDETPTGR